MFTNASNNVDLSSFPLPVRKALVEALLWACREPAYLLPLLIADDFDITRVGFFATVYREKGELKRCISDAELDTTLGHFWPSGRPMSGVDYDMAIEWLAEQVEKIVDFMIEKTIVTERVALEKAYGHEAHLYWRKHWAAIGEFLSGAVQMSVDPEKAVHAAGKPKHGLVTPALVA